MDPGTTLALQRCDRLPAMDPEEEREALRCALQQISANREAKQLELAQLSAEAFRLRRKISEIDAFMDKDDDASGSDQESFMYNSPMSSRIVLQRSVQEWQSGGHTLPLPGSVRLQVKEELKSRRALPPPGAMRHLASEESLWSQAAEARYPRFGTLGSLLSVPTDSPPCRYACFLAGPPLVCTVMSDLALLGCHFIRSLEVTSLSSQNLASRAEQATLRLEYSPSTMDIRPVVNFIVWRRSLIVLLSLANLGAFLFSLFGDNWATLRHMRDMHEVSDFEVSYDAWRTETMAGLPEINCAEVDAHFGEVLAKQSARHEVVARTCQGLLEADVGCSDPLRKAIRGCWQPGFCSELVSERCPLACHHAETCRDTRDAGTLTYGQFTAAFSKAMAYMLMEELSKVELQKLVFLTATKFVTTLLLVGAAVHWADWARSNRFVLLAWAVTFCAPFMRSVVPTPILIDWKPIDKQMEGFLRATDEHYNVSTRMASLAQVAGISCKDHAMEDKVDDTWSEVHGNTLWWCEKVTSASRWFPWSATLRQGAEQCQVVTNEIGIGDDATHLLGADKEKICGLINTTKVEDVRENPLGSLREVLDVPWARNVAKGFIGTMSSILSFRALMPLALSIAPGLLTAAIRIKVMIPESYLPGVFIVIMPLLYVPLIWSFSMFIVQGVGDPCLLVGITLLVFSSLAYTAFALSMRVTSPMSRRGAQVFAIRVWWVVAIMRVVGLACIGTYVYQVGLRIHEIETSRKGLAAFLIEQAKELLLPLLIGQVDNLIALAFSGPLWSLIFSFIVQLYLTAVVASDWMLRASAEEWDSHGEECLVELQESGQLDDKRELEMLHRKREAAMTAMLELTARKQSRLLGH